MQTPTPPTIIIIIGIILTTILAARTIPTTMNYNIEYFKNLACSYEAFFMGDFKAYTACTINALHVIWNALEAWPRTLAQRLGW